MPAPPSRDSGNGVLLIIVLVILAFSGGAGAATTPPSNPHYVTPSCTGLASVPGYKTCHK